MMMMIIIIIIILLTHLNDKNKYILQAWNWHNC